ncbi:MAG: hypothetical protein LBD48_02350 [Treponema sp.]|jgi:hypothetical protein|nr:hypothetical protein [Treponema sp.]
MKVISVKDIVRKDVPIYYRLLYTGVAVLELAKGPEDYRIDFSIEIKPTGQKEIIVTFLDKIDYPLVPVVKELKKIIDTMHSGGILPD